MQPESSGWNQAEPAGITNVQIHATNIDDLFSIANFASI